MTHSTSDSQPVRQGAFGMIPDELQSLLAKLDEKPYRTGQVLDWIHRRGVRSFDEMTNLPKAVRAVLADSLVLHEATVSAEAVSRDGTRKWLLRWADGQTSECVLIPDQSRRTACISTSIGCPVRCAFCASGLGGLVRNLTASQIVEQAMRISAFCAADGMRLSNVVFMGVGEPLANYANTIRAVRIINAEWGMNIGARKITISTVGLPDSIRRLASEGLQITLAVSLHAPNDELRARIIPWAKRVSVDDLVQAGRYYFDQTGREVTLEYVLLKDVNDSLACADQLARICRKLRSNVNLIPLNSVTEIEYEKPANDVLRAFQQRLEARGVNAHIRKSRGADIESACGQLRRRMEIND